MSSTEGGNSTEENAYSEPILFPASASRSLASSSAATAPPSRSSRPTTVTYKTKSTTTSAGFFKKRKTVIDCGVIKKFGNGYILHIALQIRVVAVHSDSCQEEEEVMEWLNGLARGGF